MQPFFRKSPTIYTMKPGRKPVVLKFVIEDEESEVYAALY
jgi:hypothetical protein